MLKGILKTFALALAFTAATAFAGEAAWSDNFQNAQKDAKEGKKALFALFTGSDWCPWCIKLEKEILSKKEFTDYAEKSLVLFKADFPRKSKIQPGVAKQNDELSNKYSVEGFPTVVVFNSEGKEIGRMSYEEGGPSKFVKSLKKIIEKSGK